MRNTALGKMALDKLNGLELPAAADMHVHLRDGDMTSLVVYKSLFLPKALKNEF